MLSAKAPQLTVFQPKNILERLNYSGNLFRITTVGQIYRLLSPNGLLTPPPTNLRSETAQKKLSVFHPGYTGPIRIRQRFHQNFVDKKGDKKDLLEYSTGWFLNPRNPVMYQVFNRYSGIKTQAPKQGMLHVYGYEPELAVDHIVVLEVKPVFTNLDALTAYEDALYRCGVIITDGAVSSDRTSFFEISEMLQGVKEPGSNVRRNVLKYVRAGLQIEEDGQERFWWNDYDDSKRRLLSEVLIPYKGGKYDSSSPDSGGPTLELEVIGIHLAPPPPSSRSSEEPAKAVASTKYRPLSESKVDSNSPSITRALSVPSSLLAQQKVKQAIKAYLPDNKTEVLRLTPQFFFLPETLYEVNDRITINSGDPFFTRCNILAVSSYTTLENLEIRLANETKLRYPDVLLKWHELSKDRKNKAPESILYQRYEDIDPRSSIIPPIGPVLEHSQPPLFNSLLEYLDSGAWSLNTLPNPSNKNILFVVLKRLPREQLIKYNVMVACEWLIKNADKVFGKEGVDSLALTSFGCRPNDGHLEWDEIREVLIEAAKKLTGTWDVETSALGKEVLAKRCGVGSDKTRDLKKNPYVRHMEIWLPDKKVAETLHFAPNGKEV